MRGRACLDKQFILEELPALSSSEVCVLMCLHLHHSVERGCWPGVKVITDLTGLHRATVHAAIVSLKEKELVVVERVDGKPCYWLPVNEQNVLQGGPAKWADCPVSPYDDSQQDEVSPNEDEVSPFDDKVSPTDDKVSPYDDSECRQETTVPRMPRAGACAHTPKEVSIERTKEVTPPAAPGLCIHAPGEPETPSDLQRIMDENNRRAAEALTPEQQKAHQQMRRDRDRREPAIDNVDETDSEEGQWKF